MGGEPWGRLLADSIVKSNPTGTMAHVFPTVSSMVPICGAPPEDWGTPIVGTPISWGTYDARCCCEQCWRLRIKGER